MKVFSEHGEFLFQFDPIDRETRLFAPNQLTINATAEEAYITDAYYRHRVWIFSTSGEFRRHFGFDQCHTAEGIVVHPHTQEIIVASLRHSLQVLDRRGNLLRTFDNQACGDKAFYVAQGLCADSTSGYVMVADSCNDRVCMTSRVVGVKNCSCSCDASRA